MTTRRVAPGRGGAGRGRRGGSRWRDTRAGRRARENGRIWWRYLAGPAMVVVLIGIATELGPSWSAHLGHGRVGTWTVTRVICSKQQCNDVGRFVSASGTDVRAGISMSGAQSLGVGASLPAVDTGGGEVYPRGGGSAWLAYTIGAALLAVGVGLWTWTFPVAVLRRRRRSRRGSRWLVS